MLFALGSAAVLAGLVYALLGGRGEGPFSTPVVAQSATPKPAGQTVGGSGQPVPRFVSLKTDRVNVRRGPSSEHNVAWVFTRRGLPVEVVAEFEHWRRIRDSEGEEGWVYHSLLAGRRTAMVAPWRKGETIELRAAAEASSGLVAQVTTGVVGDIESCDGTTCRISLAGYKGYIDQAQLWGVYPGEQVDN